MKNKSSKKWVLIAVGSLIFIAVLIFSALKIIDIVEKNKRASNTPPTIQVLSPSTGDAFAPGESVLVLASALGRTPIQYIELWFDNNPAGKVFNSQLISGLFPAEFAIEMPAGVHSLYVRALDQDGLVAQTIPMQILSSAEAGEVGLGVYSAQEGETLVDIAQDFGVDNDTLKNLNPALGDNTLPPGSMVNLPPTDTGETTGKPPAPPVPQAPNIDISGITFLPIANTANEISQALSLLAQLKPPTAPSGLQVFQDGCYVVLTWMDNSTNEDRFNIWISGLGVTPRKMQSVSSSDYSGRVYFRFTTPYEGIYNFWVEAENTIGTQPSESVWIGIPPMDCGEAIKTAGFLFLVVDRLEVFSQVDRVYCYVSAEGAPELRFPDDDSLFFHREAQPGMQAADIFIGGTLVLQYPEDGVVDLEGECLGWSGNSLNSLGKFKTQLSPPDESPHDEFRDVQQVKTPNFNVWFFIRPYGWEKPQESLYTFFDPTLPVPYNLQLVDTGKRGNPFHPTDKMFTWDWAGDSEKIIGFTIWVDGKAYKAVGANTREVYLPPPVICGADVKIEVTAGNLLGRSARSQALIYHLEPCRTLAQVELISMHVFRSTRKTAGIQMDCAPLEVRYAFWGVGAVEVSEKFFGYPYELDSFANVFNNHPRLVIKCNKYVDFSKIGHTNKILVPIDPNNPRLIFGLHIQSLYSGHIVYIRDEISLPVSQWNGFEDVREYNQDEEGAQTSTVIRIRGFTDVGQ